MTIQSYRTYKVTEDDERAAIEAALDGAPVRFNITEGHVLHIAQAEREARKRRLRRNLR